MKNKDDNNNNNNTLVLQFLHYNFQGERVQTIAYNNNRQKQNK